MHAVGSRYHVGFHDTGDLQQKGIRRMEHKAQGGSIVYMVRGLQKQIADLVAPEHPSRTIYLDGACAGPLYDVKRKIYSLDHHEGCIRAITLSTCEQAMRLVRTQAIGPMGYTIMGNDPDLDTTFAAWALLNAERLAHDDTVFRRMLPLFQLEGNIDALGLGYEELTGQLKEQIRESRARINWLMQRELQLKRSDRWNTIDWIDYLEESFDKLDSFAFYEDQVEQKIFFDAHHTYELANGQTLEYVQAACLGSVYDIERELQKRQQQSTACLIYHDGKNKWTLKLAGIVSEFDLARVFDALNAKEQQAMRLKNVTDERFFASKWGGGSIIGGAPRHFNGASTFLDQSHIIQIVFQALQDQVTQP